MSPPWSLIFEGVVTRVFPRSAVLRVTKVGDDVRTERGPELWYVQIGDISFQVGDEQPLAQVGDRVAIEIRKVPQVPEWHP